MDVECTKGQTIRGLLVSCQKEQGTIKELLESNFNRQPQKEEKCAGMASRPNVLDEIMDGLTELSDAQKRTIEFIKTYINPKL